MADAGGVNECRRADEMIKCALGCVLRRVSESAEANLVFLGEQL
jgi:hypothetical protein